MITLLKSLLESAYSFMLKYSKISVWLHTLIKRLWLKWRTKTMHAFATFGCHLTTYQQSLWWGKLGHQGAICWLKKELSMVHGTLNIFLLGIKLICVCQHRNLIFSASLWLIISWNFTNLSSFGKLLFLVEKCHLNVCLNELKFSQNLKSNRH